MEKYYFEKELKEAVLIKSNEKPVTMVLNGEEVEVCSPELCSMNIAENGSHCLVSEDKASNDKKHEVVAFSLDIPNRGNKDWICLEPIIIGDAVEYFLANHHMEEMVSGCIARKKMESRGGAVADFIAGDAYIEINVPDAILNAAGNGWMQVKSLMLSSEKAVKCKHMVSGLEGGYKRFILLTVFQYGLNDSMKDFLCRELSRFFGVDMQENIEFWVIDLRLEPDGITLLSYQNVTGRVMLE